MCDANLVSALFSLISDHGEVNEKKYQMFVNEQSRISFYGDFLSAVFFVALWLMNLLPAKYVTIIGLVLLLFFVCVVSTQLLSKKKGIAGKVISILLSIGLIFGSYYIFKTTNVKDSAVNDEQQDKCTVFAAGH